MIVLSTISTLLIAFSSNQLHLTQDQQLAVLQEAQIAYDAGITLQTADPVASKESFRRSAERFQVLVHDGIENGKLWYNLGNAQLQAGEIGEAIGAYRSAQRYIPSDGRVTANLQHARSKVSNPIKSESTTSILKRLAFWHDSLPTQLRLTIGIIFWFGCWSIVSVRLFRTIPGFKTASISLGCAALALGISVGADIVDQHQDHGVLTANEVIVRKGNGVNYAPMLKDPIHEGIEFDIIEKRPDWLHIKLPNGSTGWIQEEDAQIVTLDASFLGKHI
jgi:tetratricopeptide (TPR) repeat protein